MNLKIRFVIEWMLVGVAVLAIGAYLYVAFSRVAYPYVLEWTETGTFSQVARILAGKPLYAAPAYEYIPMLYPPLYFYIGALFASSPSQILTSARLVSIVSSIFIFLGLYGICRLRQVNPRLSLVAAGLFGAAYAATGYWLDLARVDSLFLALLIATYFLALLKTGSETITGMAAGLFLALATITKQTALLAVPFIFIMLLASKRQVKAAWFGIFSLGGTGLIVALLNLFSDGWFLLYTLDTPAAHPTSWKTAILDTLSQAILPSFLWLLLVIVLGLIACWVTRKKTEARDFIMFMLVFFVPLAGMGLSSMAKQWGWKNGLLPLVVGLVVIGVNAFHLVATASTVEKKRLRYIQGIYFVTVFAIAFQFVMLRYDPRVQIPSSDSVAVGDRIVNMIRSSKPPVFIPSAPYLLGLADLPENFFVSSLSDLQLAAKHSPKINQILDNNQKQIFGGLLDHSIPTAVLPNAAWYDGVFSTLNGYKCESLAADQMALTPMTGVNNFLERICWRSGPAVDAR